MENIKKILVCPLNWGLGHASRVIPVIYELLHYKCEVYIGADGYALELLKHEFPELKYIRFPSFTISYGKRKSFALEIFIQLPKIIFGIIKEHFVIKRLIVSYSFDLVISDNRFGLWNKKITTIYITHQINVKLPKSLKFFETYIYKINKLIISKYNQCWIPDFANPSHNLTGDLSHDHKLPDNTKFIGPLSRFKMYLEKNTYINKYKYDLLVILSGPEPQRAILEKQLIDKIQYSGYKALIIQGRPGEKQIKEISDNITSVSHISTRELLFMIYESEYIICRSGYSTIMDLITLKRTAILIPTPGQTEQEYLASYLSESFYCIEQNNINLENSIKDMNKFRPIFINTSDIELKNNIQNLKLLKNQAKKCNRKES